MTKKTLRTVKDLKDFLNQFDDDKEVLFQMVDGEYDRVGFITNNSVEHSDFTKKYYLRDEKHFDAVLLICDGECVSSQY